jgi:hypothetical protein
METQRATTLRRGLFAHGIAAAPILRPALLAPHHTSNPPNLIRLAAFIADFHIAWIREVEEGITSERE